MFWLNCFSNYPILVVYIIYFFMPIYIIIISLILLSGLFSGLTLGLLGLDVAELKRKMSLGNKDAEKVYHIRKRGNLLLCTLLLGNVWVNSTLAIFLGSMASGAMAGIIATGLIVIFGEIIPQAAFSRYALQVGAKTAGLVRFFIIILFPVCWPIAWVLDKVLGREMPQVYSKKELIKIIEEHEDAQESGIDADEERIVTGALTYSEKIVEDDMTPRKGVYALDSATSITEEIIEEIKIKGFTRIPVYTGSVDQTLGVLYVKDLLNIPLGTAIQDVFKKERMLQVSREMKLDTLLAQFIQTQIHLAVVKDIRNRLEGVISLEDIIEVILNQDINDETDVSEVIS